MASIQNFVYGNLVFLFFPKQMNTNLCASEIFLNTFKKNYVYERCYSMAIGSSFLLSGVTTIGSSIHYGISSTTTLSSLVAAGALGFAWYKSGAKSYDLALKAYRSISEGDEKAALDFIKLGANVYQDFSHLSIKPVSPNLLIQATKYGCTDVIKFLLSLSDWDLNANASLLGHAPNLETAQILVQLGANVNLYNGCQSSPLWIQLVTLSKYLNQLETIDFNLIEKQIQIVDFLITAGGKLQDNPPRFNEKDRAWSQMEINLIKISTLSDSIKLPLNDSIKKIQKRLV